MDSRFPYDIGKIQGGQTLMKNEKIYPIVDARRTLLESGKTQKDNNKNFDHDKVIPRSSIPDMFSASRIF